jgi:hypothetical protein
MKTTMRLLGIALLGFPCLAVPPAAAEAPARFVAGLVPDRRPADAPAIKDPKHDDAWRSSALRGVVQPAPDSVTRFLGDQGAWYTPFSRPGMPGPYDIRGMHAGPAKP